jgi:hypothetical protein
VEVIAALGPRLILLLGSATFVLLFFLFRRRGDIWDPVNLVFYLFGVEYLVPALLFVIWPTTAFGRRMGLAEEALQWSGPALFLVLGFLVFFCLGASAPGSFSVRGSSWQWSQVRVRRVTYLWLATFMGITLVYLFPMGGLSRLLDHFQLERGTGWITPLMIGSAFFLPMLLWTIGRRWTAVAVVAVQSGFFLLSSGRLMGVLVWFWFLLYLYYLEGRRWLHRFVFLAPLFLPLSIYVVIAPYTDEIGFHAIRSYNWAGLFQTEVGRLESLAIYLWYSIDAPYFDLGKSWILGAPGPVTPWLYDHIDYRNVISGRLFGLDESFHFGMGGTGVLDLWMMGALGGVLLGAFVYGFAWQRAYTRMLMARNPFHVLLYTSISIFLFQAVHEGLPLGTLWFTLIPFGVLALIAGVRPRLAQDPALVTRSQVPIT